MIKKNHLFIAFIFTVISCSKTQESDSANITTPEESGNYNHHSNSISKVFDAHGGFEQWLKMKQISYNLNENNTVVDLQNRYTLIETEDQKTGFDGTSVWVDPPSEDAQNRRMRYNLMFYFYAFPFIVGDSNISYEDLTPVDLKGKTYNAVKISFGENVGDSPKDNYVICSDPESNKMEWLMYTATFGGNESKTKYSLIKYEDWSTINGLVLPGKLQWYHYENGQVGEPRGNGAKFENVALSAEFPEFSLFQAPKGAQILTD